MYKLVLSWRYLRTRYLALASIISVMLGVATLIVVNSVMGGFATKLRDRLRGIEAHVLVEARSADGFYDYESKMEYIRQLVGDKIEAMSPVIETVAMLQYRYRKYDADGRLLGMSDPIPRPVRLFGVDPVGKSRTGEFARHLLNPAHRADPARTFLVEGEVKKRHRRYYPHRYLSLGQQTRPKPPTGLDPDEPPPPEPPQPPDDAIRIYGAVVGYGIATVRNPHAKASDPDDVKDKKVIRPGDEITIAMMSQTHLVGHDGSRGYPRPVVVNFVVTDLFKSGMSEFDSNLIFIDLRDMQRLRTMYGRATSIQIKLKNYDRDKDEVLATLRRHFHPVLYHIDTWERKRAPLLAAIAIERGILNVLLFLIIAVAGFGILAIFFMIVVEKTRDIGILKALGASNRGVMGIFLSYGLGLGLVGALLGTGLGVTITLYINEIERWIGRVTGQDVFPRDVYYFDRIPTDMQMSTLMLVNFGAIFIAVAASVFPAIRAALLRPVQALRYE